MPNGFGYGGGGSGWGMGFGFRGTSPPWPYVGRGRGGLPRCWHPGLYGTQAYWQPWQAPVYAPAGTAFVSQITQEQELDSLRNQAQAIKGQLEQIETRIHDLEAN